MPAQPHVPQQRLVTAPGRVNLIGEHIDYHNLSVLPIAIPRAVRVCWKPLGARVLRVMSEGAYGERIVPLDHDPAPGAPGDWGNYAKAAVRACRTRWHLDTGIDASIESDLPPAAGLSSSSALLTALTLALLQASGIELEYSSLMEILPEGEHFVGTRGGGMDHAAVLACRRGAALLVGFSPASARQVPLPAGWEFLAAHSTVMAEKSGAVREEYNARRTAGLSAVQRLGFGSFRDALAATPAEELCHRATRELEGMERRCFLHVVTEAARVGKAVDAIESADLERMGRLLDDSHASLRDHLQVSCPELNSLVEAARSAGAAGARLTGAGFGGFALVLCGPGMRAKVREKLLPFYAREQRRFDPGLHLIDAVPSDGALALIATGGG